MSVGDRTVEGAIDLAAAGAPVTGAPELGKGLLPRHVEMIAIGGIIGAGLFVGSSAAINAAGPAVIFSYGLAGLIVMLVMRMLSEMAMAIPGVQSFPEFARIGIGHWAGFMSGWLYWYFWVVVVAIEAIAGAKIIHLWLPDVPVWGIGVALMAVLTGVNLMSTRSYGEFEFWFSSIKVAAIIAFIVIGLGWLLGSDVSPGLVNLTAHQGFAPAGGFAVLGAVTTVIFSLVGAEIATIAAAESADSGKTVARMAGLVAWRILIFYILSIAVIVSVVPWVDIVPGNSPFAAVLAAIEVPGGATIMNAIVLVAVLSCLNSGLYVTSRVLFALAARRDAPQYLVALDSRKVPVRAILFGSIFSYVALAASVLSPEMVFSFLVAASGAIMIFIYMMISVAQLRIRARFDAENPAALVVKMWFQPWGTILALVAMAGVLVAMALTPGLVREFIASLVTVAIVGIGFLVFRRGKATA
ncbi:amino acid permease [Polymorphobacter sp.]|uniref:amino acid permease n=1 Tax=Polymorphobacter sp. TaxID=1909290 RepID=UPI003F6E46EA